MKKINLILISLISVFSIFLSSCETEVTGVSLPYEETVVVYGLFTAGELSDGLYLARTVPPLEKPTIENSKITDAVITIKQNDKLINLVYDEILYYKTLEPLIPQAGDKLELTIIWKGKEYKSETYIPEKADNEEVYFTYNVIKNPFGNSGYDVNILMNFKANSNDTYLVGNSYTTQLDTLLNYSTAIQGSDKLTNKNQHSIGYIYVNSDTSNLNIEYMLKENNINIGFIEVLDKAFYNFYVSRYNGEDMSSVFGTSGLNVKGNISNKGMGIFIGRNRSFFEIDKIVRD